MEIEKIYHENLGDKVYRILKEKIVRWELKPGQRLKDREVAESLEVSRSLVRNAFALLEKEDLVVVSRKGVYVAEFTKRQIEEIGEVRKLLEPFALKSAIETITQEELEGFERTIKRAERELKEGQLEACYQLDISLHQLIISRCNNSQIKKAYSYFQNILAIFIRSDYRQIDKVAQSFEEHRRIFDALKKRDLQEANEVLLSHLSKGLERALGHFGTSHLHAPGRETG